MPVNKRIWVAWLHHRRNVELSRVLHADRHELIWRGARSLRYPFLTFRTLRLLLRARPRIVFAQNPSLLLALLLCGCKPLMGFRLVLDAHNAALEPLEGKSSVLNALARTAIRQADLTLVTNEALLETVHAYRGVGHVLPDPIPTFQDLTPQKRQLEGKYNIVFVCTFSRDEPYGEVLRAAELLDEDTVLYVTGDYLKAGLAFADLPQNVRLTGFVSDEDYVSLLLAADLIVDLTTRENCLVCGAYEAVACEKPLLVSDTHALRSYFREGALYTKNTHREIAQNLRKALEQRQLLAEQMRNLKRELAEQWSAKLLAVETRLESW